MAWTAGFWYAVAASVAALTRSATGADVGVVSFADNECADHLEEITFASNACFRVVDPRGWGSVAARMDCAIDGRLTRELWVGPSADCVGEATYRKMEYPQCQADSVFGGRSRTYKCLNTLTRAVVRIAYHDDAGCATGPRFDAPAASGSCYNGPRTTPESLRLTCNPAGDGVLVERFAATEFCAGAHAGEVELKNGERDGRVRPSVVARARPTPFVAPSDPQSLRRRCLPAGDPYNPHATMNVQRAARAKKTRGTGARV